MGMYDTFEDDKGGDWQAKAMDCELDRYRIGDEIGTGDFQMLVLGDVSTDEIGWAYVTIRSGIVAEIGVPRDAVLPCIDYGGGPLISEPVLFRRVIIRTTA